jgi:hypothetical protein
LAQSLRDDSEMARRPAAANERFNRQAKMNVKPKNLQEIADLTL